MTIKLVRFIVQVVDSNLYSQRDPGWLCTIDYIAKTINVIVPLFFLLNKQQEIYCFDATGLMNHTFEDGERERSPSAGRDQNERFKRIPCRKMTKWTRNNLLSSRQSYPAGLREHVIKSPRETRVGANDKLCVVGSVPRRLYRYIRRCKRMRLQKTHPWKPQIETLTCSPGKGYVSESQ